MAADGRIEIDTRINEQGITEGIRGITTQLEGVGEKAKAAGEAMSKYVTLPLTAVGAAGFKMATDMQSSNELVQASLGVTAQEAGKLSDAAKNIWKNGFGDNIQGVTKDLLLVKKNMQDLNDADLQKVTQGAYTLSDVFGADVGDSTKAAGMLMKQFGVDSTTAMDLVTVGFQKGGDYSGELLDTLNEYAPQFASMGMSATDFLNTLISGAQDGAFNLDKVGDAVKEFNLRAKDGSKTTADGFAAIGLNAQQMGEAIAKGGADGKKAFEATVAALASMKDPVAQNQAGVALFGTQWEDLQKNVVTGMANSTDALGNFKGATERASAAMSDSFGNKLQTLWRNLLSSLQPVGDILLNFAENVLPKIATVINTVAQAFGSLSPQAQTVIVIIGTLIAAIGPALVIFGQIAAGVSSFIGVLVSLGGFITSMGGMMGILGTAFTFLTGPIGLTILAIAALIAIGVLVYQNWGVIKDFLINVWNTISSTAVTVWGAITTFFSNVWSGIVSVTMTVWNSILLFFSTIWAGIQNVFFTVINFIIATAQGLWNLFGSSIMQIFNGFLMYFQGIWEVIKNVFLGAILLIIDLCTGNFTKLKSDAMGIFNNLKAAFGQIWDGIKSIFSGALNFISTYISTVFNAVKNTVISVWNAITGGISSAVNGISNAVSNGFNAAYNYVTNAVNNAKNFAVNGFNSMVSSIGSTVGNVRSAISNGFESAINYLRGINLADIGRNIIHGLVNGIGSAAGAIGAKVKEIASGIPEGIRKILHIASPSKVMKNDVGRWIPEGVAAGIDENTKVVKNATVNMTKAAIPIVPDKLGINSNPVKIVSSDIAQGNNIKFENVQAKINIAGYEVTGLINFITTQQQGIKRQALNNLGGA